MLLDGTIEHWADFVWTPETTEAPPPFTTRCAGQISGVATATANGVYSNSSARSIGQLQGEDVKYAQYARAEVGVKQTDEDSATYFHTTDLTGGEGGYSNVRIILSIGLAGEAQAYAFTNSNSSSSIDATHSVITSLVVTNAP